MQAVRDDAKSEPAEPEVPLVAMQATLPERHPPGNKHHITWLSPGGERVLVHVPPDALPLSIIEFLVPEALLMEVIRGECQSSSSECPRRPGASGTWRVTDALPTHPETSTRSVLTSFAHAERRRVPLAYPVTRITDCARNV